MKQSIPMIVLTVIVFTLSVSCNNTSKIGLSASGDGGSLYPEDSVLFARTWKSPSVYLMAKPDRGSIRAWKEICETSNSEYDQVMIPSYMDGDPMERLVTFYDLAAAVSIKDPSSADAFMLWRLNEYMPPARRPRGEAERYHLLLAQMDTLLECYGAGSQADYNFHSYLESEFAWILVAEYQKRLSDAVPSAAAMLDEEFACWKEYVSAADEAFDKIKMGPGLLGSSAPMESFGFRKGSMDMMSGALIPFYLMMTDPDHCVDEEVHGIIGESDIDTEYDVFLSSVVRTMSENKYPEDYHPLEDQSAALKKDMAAWRRWMDAREKVAESLDDNIRRSYENATNNVRRRKLIDLKNRYEGYGLTSDSMLELLLGYDCSDTELSEYDYEQSLDCIN